MPTRRNRKGGKICANKQKATESGWFSKTYTCADGSQAMDDPNEKGFLSSLMPGSAPAAPVAPAPAVPVAPAPPAAPMSLSSLMPGYAPAAPAPPMSYGGRQSRKSKRSKSKRKRQRSRR